MPLLCFCRSGRLCGKSRMDSHGDVANPAAAQGNVIWTAGWQLCTFKPGSQKGVSRRCPSLEISVLIWNFKASILKRPHHPPQEPHISVENAK